MSDDGAADRPAWWDECARIKADMGLPDYEPPTFEDGTYVHEVVPAMEVRLGGPLRFIGVNTTYPEDWEVRLDGEVLFEVGRRRNEDGNTVYEVSAEGFVRRVEEAVGRG